MTYETDCRSLLGILFPLQIPSSHHQSRQSSQTSSSCIVLVFQNLLTMFAGSIRRSVSRAARTVGVRGFASSSGGGGGGAAMPLALVAAAGAGYVYYDAQQKTEALEAKINELQVDLTGKTNSAFVFIKVSEHNIGKRDEEK